MSRKVEGVEGCFLSFVAVFGLLPASLVVSPLVLKALWGWFIVPQFGARPLTYVSALGLDLVFSILQTQPYTPKSDDDDDPWQTIGRGLGRAVLRPLALLLVGYIAMRFR